MAKNSTARGKIVRRLGVNIYGHSKYDKLLKKKPQGPGQERGRKMRGKQSEYAKQLIEKQKIRFAYGVSERQFRNTFAMAKRLEGLTGDNLIILLEKRLDNVIYRLGLAPTRSAARQFVSHGHIYVNGRRVNIPSFQVNVNDEISVKPNNDRSKTLARNNLAKNQQPLAAWMSLDADALKAKVEREPVRSDIQLIGNEQLVVEFYSR
ncbi:30S ribosomal protein S4 [Entomospira culicis]|uniref:Small ribosomal subunit protein uS4 n=1 Tax=Entomospira culicis TaxID=2719989 RepID=A0A968KU84_9SPIO|nr:30S ribosomal protein S4 [Entomospira culicis]NIZ18670.1 30S ribosomal protein S4 [Entomospira culicis]NIZ68885.1 30S ribosomal protein S4 [Entomospira culicis]WDI37478.1 30S ribosomal protein S4 [Entomospira culicis]WDI39106.1 30S ribosomal protein S4 [Entomospira culicis]